MDYVKCRTCNRRSVPADIRNAVRELSTRELGTRSGKQPWIIKGTHCSAWCAQDPYDRPQFFLDPNPDTVPLYIIERAKMVFRRALVRNDHEDPPYFLGHVYMSTQSVLIVSEFLDAIDRSWFYQPHEYERMAKFLNQLASKIKYGDRHAWT